MINLVTGTTVFGKNRKMLSTTVVLNPAEIQNFLIVGASIMDTSMVPATLETLMDATYTNSSSTFYNEAVAGWKTADLAAGIDAILATYVAVPEMLVMIHIGGGDISAQRPYSNSTAAEITAFTTDITYVVDAITAAGFVPILADVTYRDYTTVPLTTVNSEVIGSNPYNDNIYTTLIQALTPDFSYGSGNSYLQFYNEFYNESATVFNADGVHPNSTGQAVLRQRFVDSIGHYNFVGSAPDQVTKVNPDPLVSSGIYRTGFYLITSNTSSDSITQIESPINTSAIAVISTNDVYDGITFSFTGSFGSPSLGGVRTGDDSGFLLDAQMQNSFYVTSGNTATVTITELATGETYTLRVSGSKTSGATDRTTDIDVSGETQQQYRTTISGVGNTAEGAEFTGLSPNGSGEIAFTVSESDGTTSYVGGFDLILE